MIDNVDVTNLNDSKLSKFRNTQIGFIFQFHELLPEFSAIENVIIPAIIKGVEVCPISMHEFKEGDDILRIKSCKHIFREMNLRQWFRYSSRCPICRYDIRDWVG